MLETVKSYINNPTDISFEDFYQDYICKVQDMNIQSEVAGIKTDEITSINRLLQRLNSI